VIEFTSPSTRTNDIGPKVEEYHRVGVPLYVIIDEEEEEGPLKVVGYRWQPGGYATLSLDGSGRLLLEGFGVWLALTGDRVAILDTQTGQEIGDYAAITQALEAEVRARQAAEQKALQESEARADAERGRAEAERGRAEAERLAREQAEALLEAERLARERAEALLQAERLARERAEALLEADRRERQAAQDRLALEARVKELEAQMGSRGSSS
jgi:hypothetical protein